MITNHNDLGTLTKMVGAPSFKMALNLNNRNLGKKKIKKHKKNGKNHKSKSKNKKKKNIFDHGDDDDKDDKMSHVCDMKNFVSTTTYEGGGDCDKAFQVTIQCNDQGDLCTFEEESVSVGAGVVKFKHIHTTLSSNFDTSTISFLLHTDE